MSEGATVADDLPTISVEVDSAEYREIMAAVHRIIDRLVDRFDVLRETDRDAVRLAHNDLSKRLEGFPQQFATKVELEAAANALQRLEKDALSRELYEQNHGIVEEDIDKLEREKLNASVFNTFIENYRIEQERAATERREVATVLATATDSVRTQVLEERGEYLTIESYDTQHETVVQQVHAVERWQYKIVGALVFATFVAPVITGTVVYFVTREFFG